MVGTVIYRPGLSKTVFENVAADIVAEHILTGAQTAPRASLFLSGGSTPGPVYQALSKLDLPWHHVDLGLVDERWVDEHDKGSNAALIKRTLLQDSAAKTRFAPMKTQHSTPQAGQASVEANYKKIIGGHSLAVLGMGTDGHVCSWFPESTGLEAAIDPGNAHAVQAITAIKSSVTGDYLERMTLTLSALEKCQSVLLLISGDEKRKVIEQAMETKDSDLPVSHILTLDTLTILHAA